MLDDGRTLDVANVIWCTGFRADLDRLGLAATDDGHLRHRRGIVESEPGLYVVGQEFLYALASSMLLGVGRDAAYVARHIRSREPRVRSGHRPPHPVPEPPDPARTGAARR